MQPREKLANLDPKRSHSGILTRASRDRSRPGEIFGVLVESFPAAMLVVDPEFEIIVANQKALQLLADPRAAGRSIFNFLGADGAEKVRDAAAQATRAESGASLTCHLERFDGTRFESHWRVSAVGERDGKPQAYLLMMENDQVLRRPEPELALLARSVAHHRWAEEALIESGERYRIVAETAIDAIATIDESGELLFVNRSAERIFGYPAQEMLGRHLSLLLPGYASGIPAEREFTGRHKDGREIFLEASFGEFTQGSRKLATGVLRDVTSRKLLEEQLRQSQKMEAVGNLAGGVAHDFNNLLTIITGYDEMLLNCLGSDSRARGYAQQILQAAEKAASLTKQLLAFSRRQTGQTAILDVNPAIKNLSKMLRRLISEDIELDILLNERPGMIRADAGQIEQIVINLVVNARDAMPGGGRITIETSTVELGEAYTRTHLEVTPGLYTCISVTDTGHGMTQATKSHMFEPFFTTKCVGAGTGLGLSTIYGIVKQYKGSIWVYSEPGEGTTIKVYLPIVDAPPQQADSDTRPVMMGGSETVLVVEDEESLRGMIKELLDRQGYTVLTASNSDEALDTARRHPAPVHLLLTDVIMPKTSGHELAQILRRLRRNTRVLYMSGYPVETIVRRGVLEAGVAFLEKPFTPEALARKVRQVLDAPGFPVT